MIGNSNRSEITNIENTDELSRSQCEVQTNDFNDSPKQFREEEQSMPSLLSSPTLYMPRPGFPQVYTCIIYLIFLVTTVLIFYRGWSKMILGLPVHLRP